MVRQFFLFFCLVLLSGCCIPEQRNAMRMLPEDFEPQSYDKLLFRIRSQVTLATEAFYKDDWIQLEDVAKALEQTSRFLVKAKEPPEQMKTVLAKQSKILAQEAKELRNAAHNKDVDTIQASLQSIHKNVRSLHNGSD